MWEEIYAGPKEKEKRKKSLVIEIVGKLHTNARTDAHIHIHMHITYFSHIRDWI